MKGIQIFDNYGECFVELEIENGKLKYSFNRDYPYLMNGKLLPKIIEVAESHREQIIEFDKKYDCECVAHIGNDYSDEAILIEKYDDEDNDYDENIVEFPIGSDECNLFVKEDDLLDKFKRKFDDDIDNLFEYYETSKYKGTMWEIIVNDKSNIIELFDEYGIGYSIEYWNNGDIAKVSIKVDKDDIERIELELEE